MAEGLKEKVIGALQAAQNGLRWYVNDADYEMLNELDEVISLLEDSKVFISQWETDMSKAPKAQEGYYEHPWLLGTDGRSVDAMRWCTEYPCSEGVWMLNYEPRDYIDGIARWNPTAWAQLPKPPNKEK